MPTYSMGSKRWLESVFSSPPVDKLKHRSSYTQTHQPWQSGPERFAPVQGRGELHAFLALSYLKTLGLVGRFKEHPFETDATEFGRQIKPDFLAEILGHGEQPALPLVLEIKTARFLTEAVALELHSNQVGFAKFGLQYSVWTDRHPLRHGLRHNLINMHRASGEDINTQEVLRLRGFVSDAGSVTALKAIEAGFDLDCIFAAAWRGVIHFGLDEFLNLRSELTVNPVRDLRQIFLARRPASDDWWSSLARA